MKKIILFIAIFIISYLGYLLYNNFFKEHFIYESILENTNEKNIIIDKFTIYGKYLNLEGTLPQEGNYELVLKNNDTELNYEIIKEDKLLFKTSNYINDGINLEKIDIGDYILLLKDKNNNSYYSLTNNTKYHDNEYYTFTRNRTNNLIKFKELEYLNKKYWTINVSSTILPNEFYDVVIDPGHGGTDTGASNGKYHESKFTLDYAKSLKEALEEEGLKVKLTREEDKKIDHYGVGSRTGIPYEVKAKLMLSIHLNSSNSKKQKGVEIYKAYYDNNNFAKVLADNVVKEVKTVYSNNPQSKIIDGVYMRKYTESDIKSFIKDAQKAGYEPYDFTNDLTYYYFIRETGGIMTKAFSDGRNPKYKANPYRDYNQGVEAYLCELAYISQNDDLNLVLNKKDSFIKALKTSVLSYTEISN